MRPIAPQLLAPKFFFKWKQRHQVRYGFGGGGRLQAQYPPPYSTAAQVGALCSFLFRTSFCSPPGPQLELCAGYAYMPTGLACLQSNASGLWS